MMGNTSCSCRKTTGRPEIHRSMPVYIPFPVLFRIPFDLPVAKHWEPGSVTIINATPKIFIIFSECAMAVCSSGLLMKLTYRFRISGLNANVFLMSWWYFSFSSFISMCINALLYTRCIPSVRTKYPSSTKRFGSSRVLGMYWFILSTTSARIHAEIICRILLCSMHGPRETGYPSVPGCGYQSRENVFSSMSLPRRIE